MKDTFDVVISFDDTGSMASVRKQVRKQIEGLANTLFEKVQNLRIGIAIHNDYCDRDLLQLSPFMTNSADVCEFVNRSSSQGGGDSDEAYAYVLNAASKMDWVANRKILIMIGDAKPHEKGTRSGGQVELFDWREECRNMADKSIKIYSVQALGNRASTPFYEKMASLTNGIKLDLNQFEQISTYLEAIIYNENGQIEHFEDSKPEFKTNLSFRNMFDKLRKRTSVSSPDTETMAKYAELASKYQVLKVDFKTKIKQFVEEAGATYKKGRGFYQLVNSELVQANKEVIFVDKATGETFLNTAWCREQMNLPYGTAGKVNPRSLTCARKYDIFIQSNSYTRDLDPDTKFLYELNHI